jgi:uncharacterized protein with HEPN domain
MKDDRVYLEHILECIRRIEDYTKDGRDAFLASYLIQDGTLRNFQTMAEATQRLSQKLKEGHPAVDWRAISGFRNVLVHDYLGIDIEDVYKIIEIDLPGLKTVAESLLQELGNN